MASRKKPTFASVTTLPCSCGYLEGASDEPENPIFFAADVNEYQFRANHKGGGMWVIYHCPFCGGAAPESKRASLFAVLTTSEELRLRRLTRGLMTITEVTAKFGRPDCDMAEGLTTRSAGSRGRPPSIATYRTLVYSGLSRTADVHFTDYGPKSGVQATFQGKYVGKQRKVRSSARKRGRRTAR